MKWHENTWNDFTAKIKKYMFFYKSIKNIFRKKYKVTITGYSFQLVYA